MKTLMKCLVVLSVLMMTSCLSDVQKEVKQEYNLSKIMCGYAWNKSKSEVVLDEFEARLDRYRIILKKVDDGKINYYDFEFRILDSELVCLTQSTYFTQADRTTPQMKRIMNKINQLK